MARLPTREGWVFLDQKRLGDGGSVASYKIKRRERPAGDWVHVGMAVQSETTLTGQDRTKDWEYRTCRLGRPAHVNAVGEGLPSNTVAAVV